MEGPQRSKYPIGLCMKIPMTPFVKGVDRSVDDVAQGPSGMRDCMNVVSNATGRLDGLYRGITKRATTTSTATRWRQWGVNTVILQSNPAADIEIVNSAGASGVASSPGEGAGCQYDEVFAIGGTLNGAATQAGIIVNPATLYGGVYVGLDAGNGWGLISGAITGGPTYTINFATNLPVIPAGKTAQYILFDRDADLGTTTARVRPVTGVTGSPITSLTFTVADGTAPPTGALYAYIIFGASATDTFSPQTFATYRNRLAASLDNEVYFAGWPGQPSPFFEPEPQNWAYWYDLNSVTVGHAGQGSIVRMEALGDSLFVFLQTATYRIYGYPPINGAYDNQLVVQEVAGGLGISTYDSICRAPDNMSLYVIGSDGDLYQFNGAYVAISEPILNHPRFTGLTHCFSSDKFITFTGIAPTPNLVPGETYPRDCGLLYQMPATFCYNIDKREFTILDQYGLNSTQDLVPVTDPYEMGVIGSFYLDGEWKLAISEPGAIRILNDPDLRAPTVDNALCMGVATHQISTGAAQFMPNTVSVLTESSYVPRLPVCVNAENPAGSAPLQKARDVSTSTFGTTDRFKVCFSEPDPHNYTSVAVGYWGERLVSGTRDWSAALTAITIDATPTLQKISVAGRVDRIDVLLGAITTARLTIYNGTTAAPDLNDVIFATDMIEPQNGLVNNAAYYWRSFAIGLPNIAQPYWIGLTGTCTAYRIPSGGLIYKSGATLHNGYSFALRVIEEAGGAYAAKSILSVSVEGMPMANEV